MIDNKPIRGRCALCRCRAKHRLYGFRVCHYHITHGEGDPDCPYCFQYKLYDPRWTYTVTGQATPNKVQVRQMRHPNTVFLDDNGEAVLSILSLPEPMPNSFRQKTRRSAVVIGIGLQMGTEFSVTQWGSEWERELLNAARPTLALTSKLYTLGKSAVSILAGDGYGQPPTWPTINVRAKSMNVRRILEYQDIRPNARENDIEETAVMRMWRYSETTREAVWRHNYLDVLDLVMRVFQIEWPECDHDWQEQPGEPPVDTCSRCGAERR
jgi:hypothetical protein